MEINKLLNQAYDVIIVAGQSNAEGHGLGATDNPFEPNDKIHALINPFKYKYKYPENHVYVDMEPTNSAQIEIASERIEPKDGMPRGKFYLWFAKRYADELLKEGRKVLLVETAVGGTGFKGEHWGENDLMFKRMIEMADLSLSLNPENKIVAFLWHQGEHDAYENRTETVEYTGKFYQEKLENLINIVRGRYGEDLPFICAGFTPGIFTHDFPKHCEVVISKLVEITQKINSAKFIETTDLKSNSMEVEGSVDLYHFSRRSLERLGNRYFEAYKEILNKK